jgi:Mg-chelatase subunit ChlD
MNDWASRRKNVYLAVVVLFFTTISFFVFYNFWYETPTCFDGIENSDEKGVDCGGSCSLLCKSEVLEPIVRWDPRMFEVLPGIWSVVVYVENPNISADAVLPYKFVIYGTNNQVLEEREGVTLIPKAKTVGVFEGSISLGEMRPSRALFEIGENIVWRKNITNDENISITHSPILRLDSAPRVEAQVKNESVREVRNIELVAVIFDGEDNAITASRTFIERIPKNEFAEVFFTWPKPFDLGARACSRPSSSVLLIDRSGSMASISQDPPEPLTMVKNAASTFVDGLLEEDKVGVISFANSSSNPVDAVISNEYKNIKNSITSIKIENNSTQYTNIFDAIHSGFTLLSSSLYKDFSRVIILLTDGVATYPQDPNGKGEKDDIVYAERLAIDEAVKVKNEGVSIYTIGLGDGVNQEFLKNVASSQNHYYFAPSARDLKDIYKNISSDICKEVPARIEITYKILN